MGEGRKRKLSVAVERAVTDETALVLDTFGGKLHVKFDHTALQRKVTGALTWQNES